MASADSRVLVLGTIPGVESLRRGQYYGNPRNQFWRIVCEALGRPMPVPYEERIAFLIRHRIALWDMLQACDRQGSLDAAIDPGSECPNDLPGFLRAHPEVRAIALNGATAFRIFRRFSAPHLVDLGRTIEIRQMPSTSPALTTPFETKLLPWKAAFALWQPDR